VNKLLTKEVFIDLAMNFRLPLITCGGSDEQDHHTHFSPTKCKAHDDSTSDELSNHEITDFQQSLKREHCCNKANFFQRDHIARNIHATPSDSKSVVVVLTVK
jgi:hypothetical protein